MHVEGAARVARAAAQALVQVHHLRILVLRHSRLSLDLCFLHVHLYVPVVAGRPPVVEAEVDVAVSAHQLRRFDLDHGRRLPPALQESQVTLPAVIHGETIALPRSNVVGLRCRIDRYMLSAT